MGHESTYGMSTTAGEAFLILSGPFSLGQITVNQRAFVIRSQELDGKHIEEHLGGLSSDSNVEKVGLMNTDHEETLQKHEDVFQTANQI